MESNINQLIANWKAKPPALFDPPDVLIVAHQRAGTHFLQSSLASHTAINPRGECVMQLCRKLKKASAGRSVSFDDPNFVNKAGCTNIAIVMYSQVANFEQLCGGIVFFPIIHLLRNPKNVALSLAQMRADKAALGDQFRAHYTLSDTPHEPTPYSDSAAEALVLKIARRQREFSERLASHSSVLTISYEELCEDRQTNIINLKATTRLLDFLRLEQQLLRNNLRKTNCPREME